MSDSDEEPIPNNATMLRKRFPFSSTHNLEYSVNNPNMTEFGFQNNITSSTLKERINFTRRNYGVHGFDQRSAYYRRETSPMSVVPDFRPHNRDHSYCRSEMGTQRSIISGISGSIRSNDTIVSAVDVADAIRNAKFNNSDLGIIKHALSNYYKNRSRRRIEKRRKLRRFFKLNRRKSGDDSGEQGSDSALSSDDLKSTRSVKTLNPKQNILKPRNRNEINKFTTVTENDMYEDINNFKNKTLNNLCSYNNRNLNDIVKRSVHTKTQDERFKKDFTMPSQKFNTLSNKSMYGMNSKSSNGCRVIGYSFSQDTMIQKGPESQRKDQEDSDSAQEEIFSNQSLTQYGYTNKMLSKTTENDNICNPNKNLQLTMVKNVPSGIMKNSDFNFKKPQLPFRKQIKSQSGNIPEKSDAQSLQLQRCNINYPRNPIKLLQTIRDKEINEPPKNQVVGVNDFSANRNKAVSGNDETDSDEIFANITVKENSVRSNSLAQKRPLEDNESNCSEKKRNKVVTSKTLTTKLTVKENCPIKVGEVQSVSNKNDNSKHSSSNIEHSIDRCNDVNFYESTETQSNKSSFEKSSFIKRKLFTQKLDMMENKNLNGDNIKSPQVNNLREKNKVRKLATSQSCLSRDVLEEDNVLELIHKIVPPDQMNLTNATNKTATRKSNLDEDKWDVTSVLSKCDNGDVSDTFTDEEIFQVNNDIEKSKTEQKRLTRRKTKFDIGKKCKVVIEKMQKEHYNELKRQNKKELIEPKRTNTTSTKKTISNLGAKSFWDIGFETDIEESNESSLKQINNINQDNIPKDIAAKKPNENKSFRGTMLTLNSLKNSFIRRQPSHQIPNHKFSNIINSSVSNVKHKTIIHNEKTVNNVTDSNDISDKKKDPECNDLGKLNKHVCHKKEDKTVDNVKNTKASKKYIENKNEVKKVNSTTNSNKKIIYKKNEEPVRVSQRKDLKVNAKQKDSSIFKKKITKSKDKSFQNDSVSNEDRSILTRSLTLRTKNLNNNSITSNFNANKTKQRHKLLFDITISSEGEHSILTRSMSLRAQNKDSLSNPSLKPKQNVNKKPANNRDTIRKEDSSRQSKYNKMVKNTPIRTRTPRNKKN